MFSWICPKCGRENRPSVTECPDCAERDKVAAANAPPLAAPLQQAPPPAYVPPPPAPVYAAAPPPQQHYHAPAPRPPLPTWLMGILFALAFLGLGLGIYYGLQRFGNNKVADSVAPTATARAKGTNPLQKYIEVVGIRIIPDSRKKPQARFVVINHGNAELADLAGNVTLWASTARSEEDSVGTFTFKLPSLGANESREMTAPLTTKLKIYELPDWQNATADVQITSP